jgi:carboxypeptidase C (cathepsin A)
LTASWTHLSLDIFELTDALQPGCSSLEGLLQENGPFLWQYGTFKPVPNPYTWVNLTNVVWVEQPVGTGFSQGTVTATNEEDVAAQFLGFWENFVDTFALQGRKVYITGESYAGYYVPYIADAMLNKNDTTVSFISEINTEISNVETVSQSRSHDDLRSFYFLQCHPDTNPS